MKQLVALTIGLIMLGIPAVSSASSVDGTIDLADKYAWSENGGWINFGSTGNIHVTDTQLTGYAWNETTGWINLHPPTAGVTNNVQGTLGGYAWGEGIGWVNFSGVTIDSNGYFHGYAQSDTGGQISFNCLNSNTCASGNFKVRTDWRPLSARSGAVAVVSPSTQGTASGGGRRVSSSIPVDASTSCTVGVTKPIQIGKTNDPGQVKKLQQFLHDDEGEQGIVVSGIYDKKTFDAVVRFQEKYANDILIPWNQAKGTGYVYTTTLKKIDAIYCKKETGAVVAQSIPAPVSKVLKQGSKGNEVQQLQLFLAKHAGFAAPANGIFGPATKAAVIRFQKTHKLVPDGVVGEKMRKEMDR